MTKRRKSDKERYTEMIGIHLNISQKQLLDELVKKRCIAIANSYNPRFGGANGLSSRHQLQ